MPPRREIRNLPYGRVHVEDMTEAEDNTVLDLGVSPTKELPAVIIFVVGHMEDGLGTLGNLAERNDGTVRRLVKRPIIHGEASCACQERDVRSVVIEHVSRETDSRNLQYHHR